MKVLYWVDYSHGNKRMLQMNDLYNLSVWIIFQELKECSGRLFVDSEPEFSLPEVKSSRYWKGGSWF